MPENLESSTKSIVPTPPAPSPERHFFMGSLIIVPSLLVAVSFGQQGSRTTATPAAAVSASPDAPSVPALESKSLKSELEDISAQLKKIQGEVDGLPKPEPALDLKPLEGKIDELSKSITNAKPILEKVDKLGGRVGDAAKQIEGLRSEFMALKQHNSNK